MTKNFKPKFPFSIILIAFILLLNSSFAAGVKDGKTKLVQSKVVFSSIKRENIQVHTNVGGIFYSFENIYVLLNHVVGKKYDSIGSNIYIQDLYNYKNNYNRFIIYTCILNNTNNNLLAIPVLEFNVQMIMNIIENLSAIFIKKWLFEISIFFVLGIIVFYLFFRNSRNQQRSKKKYLEQKKYIDAERQRISSEMHDEIGAGLSAIKLFSELASHNRKDVDEIRQINEMVNEIADKINEIIWSTNAESDNLESLFYFIEGQSRKLFEHSDISFTASLPRNIPDGIISSQIRRTNYLLVKEIVHNVLKHSKATTVHVGISISNDLVSYMIKDNGVGFDPNISKLNAMGLTNVKLRIERLKGSLIIENYKGTVILVKIPLSAMLSATENRKFRLSFFGSATNKL